jgi:branched-chain amino acid transport system permease protein
MTELVQLLADGLAAGSIYALIAVGYSLVYGVLGLINFAHGDVFMFSTFTTVSLVTSGVTPWLAILTGLATGAWLGLMVERFTYRPLRNVNRLAATVSAVGAALVLENAAQLIWGAQTRAFPIAVPKTLFHLGGAVISEMQIIVLVTAAVLAAALSACVQYTRWGRGMRAIRDDAPTAELIGIPVNRVVATAYALGSVLGVVGGLLFSAYYNEVFIGMGFNGSINAFTAAVVGGIGSLRGAVIGGLIFGVLQSLAVGYVASGFENSVAFVVLILVLVTRPYGFFGRPAASRA